MDETRHPKTQESVDMHQHRGQKRLERMQKIQDGEDVL